MNDNKLGGGDVGCERHDVQSCHMCVSDQAATAATLQTVARGQMNDTARAALRQAVLETRTRFRQSLTRLRELERECRETREMTLRHGHEILELQCSVGDPLEIDPMLGVIGSDDVG